MEICNTIGAVKYLFKYVYKGSDKVSFSLNKPDKQVPTNIPTEPTVKKNEKDEIKNFQDARYVSASESCWRIFNFTTNSQNPHTVRLPVHLEDQQLIIFSDEDKLDDLANNRVETQLTHFLKLNETNEDVRELYYYQMPLHYVWNKKKNLWTKRKQYNLICAVTLFFGFITILILLRKKTTNVIGRMYFVHPGDNERFSLRMLLLYRQGCDITYNTFKEACIALGYAKDDNESKLCLEEASSFASSIQLRELFVLILLNCCPANPRQLWELYKDHMSDDILNEFRLKYNDPTLARFNAIYNVALIYKNMELHKTGNDLSNYANMPEIYEPFESIPEQHKSNLIKDELAYDINTLKNDLQINLPKLNHDQ